LGLLRAKNSCFYSEIAVWGMVKTLCTKKKHVLEMKGMDGNVRRVGMFTLLGKRWREEEKEMI
jgi:putative heme iron utilization protein